MQNGTKVCAIALFQQVPAFAALSFVPPFFDEQAGRACIHTDNNGEISRLYLIIKASRSKNYLRAASDSGSADITSEER